MQDPSQLVWPDEQDGFPGVFVVAGISVVTEAPGIPEVPGVTGTSGIPGVCPGAGDNGGGDVCVHAETRISAKIRPRIRTIGIL